MNPSILIKAFLGTLSLFLGTGIAQAQADSSSTFVRDTQQVEEIVVTARRSGIPVWRIRSPRTTLVLVGSLEEVSRETRWDPGSLTAALQQADRVIFPQEEDFGASPIAMVGYGIRLLQMSKLPKGQSLANMLPPHQFRRLLALRDRGILKSGFERTHPLHLAMALHDYVDGKRGFGLTATEYTKRAVKKHKLKQVPIPKRNVKQPIKALFKSSPQAHVPCLVASISLAEAGPQAVKMRSDAWAQRRVPEVVSSMITRVFETCSLDEYVASPPDWRAATRRLLFEPAISVAVLDVTAVARPGGLLDEFVAAGYEVRGPAWR